MGLHSLLQEKIEDLDLWRSFLLAHLIVCAIFHLEFNTGDIPDSPVLFDYPVQESTVESFEKIWKTT